MCLIRTRLVHSCTGSWLDQRGGWLAGGAEVAGVLAASPPRIAGMFLRGRPVPSPGCEPLGDASLKPCLHPCCRLPVPFRLGAWLLPHGTEQLYGEPW